MTVWMHGCEISDLLSEGGHLPAALSKSTVSKRLKEKTKIRIIHFTRHACIAFALYVFASSAIHSALSFC